MNSTAHRLPRRATYALVFLSICLLVSAWPFAELDADGACELCDQDDLNAGPAVPYPEASTLLLDESTPDRARPLSSPYSQIPHPPTF